MLVYVRPSNEAGRNSSILDCARPTRTFSGRALREHRRSSGSISSFVLLYLFQLLSSIP